MQVACHEISLAYRVRGKRLEALSDISFRVAEHEFVCVLGPSGCGKTTLLKILAGLLQPQRGRGSSACLDPAAAARPPC